MKFAKDLEDNLVPEWQAKYLDYKTGKKKLKAVARALRTVNATPRAPAQPSTGGSSRGLREAQGDARQSLRMFNGGNGSASPNAKTPLISVPENRSLANAASDEEGPLQDAQDFPNYGSFVPSPPGHPKPQNPPALELPDPALDPADVRPANQVPPQKNGAGPSAVNAPKQTGSAYEVGKTHHPLDHRHSLPLSARKLFHTRRTVSTPDGSTPRPFIHRLLTTGGSLQKRRGDLTPSHRDVPMEAYRVLDQRQEEFFEWMDEELKKIEDFYYEREEAAHERLQALKEQLHEMRNRRLQEVFADQQLKQARAAREDEQDSTNEEDAGEHLLNGSNSKTGLTWYRPIQQAWDAAKGASKAQYDKHRKDLEHLKSAVPVPSSQRRFEERRDFVRLQPSHEVPYRQAKRKLKLALLEFYRGLELLKSYALLNRTAFRKLNKKYDKTVHARPAGRYMTDKVNNAWFVQSDVLDAHLHTVEDLYARYFERGNHKLAVGKLRSKATDPGMHHDSAYRNGLLLGAGAVFAIQGLVSARGLLSTSDPVLQTQTQYLLQIYAGYFLVVLLFLLFCFDARVWTRAKINYVFIFEYDTRHALDWRQLSELPCLFAFLEGFFMWLNFSRLGSQKMYSYYPTILVGLTVLFLFFPAKIIYHRSRTWWLYSNWRLVLSGIYPVHFRDFFLGDMYCSETYAMGNIALFSCLYAQHWSDPDRCNSNHSRLLGFLTCLPAIWRCLQCLRRYFDTKNIFPHLVNGGKYIFTILFSMSLSMYRINQTPQLKAFFILSSAINSTYCSVWDLAMDWSLGNPYAKHPFLRDTLGFKRTWIYYLAMVLDPILRFNWIFYAIYADQLQHSAFLSFSVGLTEILRRGMWSLFRVENEHCSNVGRFRASRDVPLPYDIPTSAKSSPRSPSYPSPPRKNQQSTTPSPPDPGLPVASRRASGADLERATTNASDLSATLRRRGVPPRTVSETPVQRGIARVGTLMAEAHVQDFERRKRPGLVSDEQALHEADRAHGEISSDEDEDGEEEEDGLVDRSNEQDLRDAEDLLTGRPDPAGTGS
ncbi:MAG: hypothetical protein M1817_005161 [Caeruleum heppii]|nr:MAG: hypothetical protein M1817_005161 [Caeruleum heppii]